MQLANRLRTKEQHTSVPHDDRVTRRKKRQHRAIVDIQPWSHQEENVFTKGECCTAAEELPAVEPDFAAERFGTVLQDLATGWGRPCPEVEQEFEWNEEKISLFLASGSSLSLSRSFAGRRASRRVKALSFFHQA